jgi:predicted ATPase/DNA-binding CsgD family transcriptional regulator
MDGFQTQTWIEPLSHREIEILGLISDGLSNREIAQKLFLSVNTVKWYNKQIFSKLGVNSRTQAASLARQSSLLESPETLPGKDEFRAQHNLPLQLTSFLGRGTEIDRIKRWLAPTTLQAIVDPQKKVRLVTLTGPGGVGKTRLAIQTTLDLVEKYPDGIWLVDFAPLSDPLLVLPTVATTLGLKESRAPLTLTNLITYFQPKTILLLFDNCEHLIEACARLSAAILQSCPGVSILATSREPLDITGEVTYKIDPLPVPDPDISELLDKLVGYEAVNLFIERAQAVLPEFSITTANSSAVVEVCRRLDGLPLAIELAAARVKMLTVAEIASRLVDNFPLLGHTGRTTLPRAQTLQACIDWSYTLLTVEERLLLNRLAVFVGGWSLDAAEEVCAEGQIKSSDVFNLLAQLIEKSLVVVDRWQSNKVRYRFLETIYRFALNKLQASGEIVTLKDRHLAYFLKTAEKRADILTELDRIDWTNRINVEHDNLRAALVWSLTDRVDSSLCFRLAKNLAEFWKWRGFLEEGRAHFSKILARPGLTGLSRERAELLFQDAWLAFHQGDVQAVRSLLEQSKAIFEKLGPEGLRGKSDVLNTLATTEYKFGEARIALEHARKALEIVDEIDHPEGVFFSNYMMGISLGRLGEYELAWKYLETALLVSKRIGRFNSDLLHDMGELAVRQGDYEKGKDYLERSLRQAEEARDKWVMGMALGTLGWADLMKGNYEQARQYLARSLSIRQEIGDNDGVAWCLEKLAALALLNGELEKSVRILGVAAVLRREVNSPINYADKPNYDALLSSLRDRLGPETFQSAWDAGLMIPLGEAIQLELNALS